MSKHHQPARILVVDHDPATLSLLTAYLVSDGHTVETASCEQEAIAQVASAPPDVVLLDLIRSRLDRPRICRRIKERAHPGPVPVIVSVDGGMMTSGTELQEAGADDFICRPYRRTELLLRIGLMLRNGSLSRKLEEKALELKSAKTLLRKQAVRLVAPPRDESARAGRQEPG